MGSRDTEFHVVRSLCMGTRHPELDVVRWLCVGQDPGTAKKPCVKSCSYLLSSSDIISGFYVKSSNCIWHQVVPRSDVGMTQSLILSLSLPHPTFRSTLNTSPGSGTRQNVL